MCDDRAGQSAGMPAGKVAPEMLERLLGMMAGDSDDVIVGPSLGEDGAVLRIGDMMVAIATDPITFQTPRPGLFAVCVNANDIAVMGARPRYMLLTVILPPGTSEEVLCAIVSDVEETTRRMGITVIGGHTEVSAAVCTPVLSVTMLGPLVSDAPVLTGGVCPGDCLVQVRPLALEGTAILASEHREALLSEVGAADLDRASELLTDPGLSVVEPALLLCEFDGLHAMHDPTEGGFATGLREMMVSSGTGCRLWVDRLIVLDVTRDVCRGLGYSPLGVISSGCLLAALSAEVADEAVSALRRAGYASSIVGRATDCAGAYELLDGTGHVQPLPEFAVDELARALD